MVARDLVGMTIKEASEKTSVKRSGYSIFELQSETDTTGKKIATSLELSDALFYHPEIADRKIKYADDYFSVWVLRIEAMNSGA